MFNESNLADQKEAVLREKDRLRKALAQDPSIVERIGPIRGIIQENVPQRQKEVHVEYTRLANTISELERRVSRLCEDLAGVLASPPKNTVQGAVSTPRSTAFGSALADVTDRLEMISTRVQDMVDSLEI